MPGGSVPYHAQTADFSCGAACLAMVLAARENTEPTRKLEFDVWRQANMIGVRGIDQWGLTIPALERGMTAGVVTEGEYTFPRQDPAEAVERIRQRLAEANGDGPHFSEQDIELSWYAQQDNREKANQLGVEWNKHAPTLADIRQALEAGAYPILLVDLKTLSGTWPAPHWVVVDRLDGDDVYLLDPDKGQDGRRIRAWPKLRDAMDVSRYEAKPTLVVLGSDPST
jgi:hypothetical protein